MEDMSDLGLAVVFGAGVLSFLSPCVLPLVPGYLSYVAGSSLEELRDSRRARLAALLPAAFFVLGFSTIFVLLGASASWLGRLLLSWSAELSVAAGILIALFGLQLTGLTPIRALERELRLPANPSGGHPLGAYLMGAAFAFGWTPCIGPVLGAILTLTATGADMRQGILLLALYSTGLAVPFLLAALFVGELLGRLRALGRLGRRLQQAMGVLMVLTGIAIATGWLQTLSFQLLELFPGFQLVG